MNYYMTPKETCRLLDIHPQTLRKWARDGQIDFIKVESGHHRYDAARFLEKGAAKPEKARENNGV